MLKSFLLHGYPLHPDAFALASERAFVRSNGHELIALVMIAICGYVMAYFIVRWLRQRLWWRCRRAYVACLYFAPTVCVLTLIALSIALFGDWIGADLLTVVGLAAGLFSVITLPALALELIFRPVRPLRIALRCLTALLSMCGLFALSQPERDVQYLIDAARAFSLNVGPVRLDLLSLSIAVGTGIVVVVIAHGTVNWLNGKLRSNRNLPPNFSLAIGRIVDIVVWTVAACIVLQQAGIDIKALAAFAGALGIGLGLGLQRLAASYVSGLIVLFERSVRPGDTIAVGGVKGLVTQMTVRYTTIKTGDGIEALVPNETLTLNTVLNQSWTDDRLRLAIAVHIDARSDPSIAKDVMLDIVRVQPRVLENPAPGAYVTDISGGRIRLEAQFWIDDGSNGQLKVISGINEAVLAAFHAHGIQLAPPLALAG